DTVFPTNNGITEDVQPPVENQNPVSEPVVAPVSAPMPNPNPSIPYPSRRNNEKRSENANEQIEKFYEIFKDMSFEISFMDALTLMPKFASTLKALIGNKEKLSEMVRTPLNKHCSAVILNKLPKKLGDPDKFLIPYKMPRECLKIIESKSKVRNSRNKAVVAKVSLNSSTPGISPDVAALTTEVSELKNMMKTMLIDKQKAQALVPVKAVEQSCVTCGGAHSYRNCPATDGNVYRDNIQEYVS
ncbi:hypothetical protein Tco_1025237, partial [Tanacetum coccineum]